MFTSVGILRGSKMTNLIVSVPPLLKGSMHGRAYDIGVYLEPFHLQIDAQNEGNFAYAYFVKIRRRHFGKGIFHQNFLINRGSCNYCNEQPTSKQYVQ
jgi:hypothetical protein